MDFQINLPNFDWFIGGSRIGGEYNRYFGSLGTDGATGFYGKRIYNYTVWIEKEDERETLKAAVYPGVKSFDCVPKEEIETETFDAEQNSIPIVKAWITEKAKVFFRDGLN